MNISIEHFTKKIRGVAVLDDVSLELQGGISMDCRVKTDVERRC